MKSSDKSITIALCISLMVHVGVMLYALHVKINELTAQLYRPPIPADEIARSISRDEGSEPPPALTFVQPPAIEPFTEPELPKPPKIDEDEWGEKNGKGIALSSSTGKTPLSARKGLEDQAFASRDPEGPGPIPDEPSKSLVPPGQNGDGRPPSPDALANKGTESEAEVALGHPQPPAPPRMPVMPRTYPPASVLGTDGSVASGEARDVLPTPPKSAEPAPQPAFENPGPVETFSAAKGSQILPIARPDLIAIERHDRNAWPSEVEALTRPPGLANVERQTQALPDLAPAESPTAPDIQSAITALIAPVTPDAKTLARRRMDSSLPDAPTVVEALVNPPGAALAQGLRQPLNEIAPADAPSAPAVLDAVTSLIAPAPALEQPAEPVKEADQTATAPEKPIPDARNPEKPPVEIATNTPPTPAAASATKAIGGLPGPAVPAADPAPDTGMESDPFAKIPGIVFKDGHVEARNGRQVKSIRPRLSDAARQDILSLQFPTIILKVRIDNTGKVTDVAIIRGSGSDAVDNPVYRAMWQWWFEPPKDKNGNPIPDVQLVSIHWG